MNPVLILTRNNLELTKRCVASIERQDIGTDISIVDNGSTDGTWRWAEEKSILLDASSINAGVSAGWNRGLSELFRFERVEYVLCCGNDTVLPPWFYRRILDYQYPFVTGIAVDQMEQIAGPPLQKSADRHPDFSAFLIRRECWEKVGQFDEAMKMYASDCDFHVRGHRLGIKMMKACVPFYHERSSTLRLAPKDEQEEISNQANRDREVFRERYGCLPGTPEYEALFQ